MLSRGSTEPIEKGVCSLGAVELFRLCAEDRENAEAWREFLSRYGAKIKHFIYGALCQAHGRSTRQKGLMHQGCVQQSDLFQNVIVRLIRHDCAAMKKFSGTSEPELMAYLAVICRSVVLDGLRRESTMQHFHAAAAREESITGPKNSGRITDQSGCEREILGRELISMIRQIIRCRSGHVSARDQLVFDLHYVEGLSFSQIAQCRGINLSKNGVQKLLKRLVDRVQAMASSGKPEGPPQ